MKYLFNNILLSMRENSFITYIYVYIFLMPWNIFNGQMGLLSLILIIWWILLAKKHSYFKKLKDLFKFKPLLILLSFFLFTYISLLWTTNLDSSLDSLSFYKYYWLLVPVIFTSLSKKEAENAIYLFIISLASYAIFSISIYLNILHFTFSDSNNPKGILAYAIITAYMAIGLLSSIVIFIYSKSKKMKILFAILGILFFFALFINNGRGAQVAFIATIGILLLINYKKIFTFKILLFLSSFSIFLMLIFINTSQYKSSQQYKRFHAGYTNLVNAEQQNFSGSWGHRAYMWYAAYHLIPKHPFVGAGAGDNIDEFIEFTKSHPSHATWLRSYHNQHLDTLTRYGIVGLLLQWTSIVLLLYSLKRMEFYFQFAVIFFSMTLFASLFDILLYTKPYNNVFMLIFLLLSIIAYKQQDSKE